MEQSLWLGKELKLLQISLISHILLLISDDFSGTIEGYFEKRKWRMTELTAADLWPTPLLKSDPPALSGMLASCIPLTTTVSTP